MAPGSITVKNENFDQIFKIILISYLLTGILACGKASNMSAELPDSSINSVANSDLQTRETQDDDIEEFIPDFDLDVPPLIVTTTTTTLPTVTVTTIPQAKEDDKDVIVVIGKKDPKAEKKVEPDFDPSLIVPGASHEDFVGYSELSPTIYYKAIINEDKAPSACEDSTKVSMLGPNEKEILKVCRKTLAKCQLEGSCVIIQNQKRYPVNFFGRGKMTGRFLYSLIDTKRCPHGYGVRSMCLDPFYTLAADLKIYKPGDVIYVPAVAGLDLGNGRRHHGFFIIRDMGHLIIGRGRFDFFTGTLTANDPKNPFKKLKLADKNTRLKYYLLKNPSELNKMVKKMRNYPNAPSSK